MRYGGLPWRARRFFSNRSGAGTVEFAFLSPLLILMAIVTIDLGMGGYSQMQVQTAAQAGGDYALYNYVYTNYNASNIKSAILNATSNSGIAASPDPVQFYGCATNSGIEVTSSGQICDNGQSPGTYITAYSSVTYTPLAYYFGVASSYVLKGQSTVRVQ
jgi:Flp pilus assembly protein TadG